MSRFLFVVPPLVGHLNPAIGVARALEARGHEVAWAGVPEFIGALAGPSTVAFRCDVPAPGDTQRAPDTRGPAALRFLWESFLIPLAKAMAPGVRAAVDAFRPDALVVDQQAIAGAIVANERGIPWATSATTSAELSDPLAAMPKVNGWLQAELAILAGGVDPRFSPSLVLVYSTRELVGAVDERGGTVRFVGPSIAPRPASGDFPWAWLGQRRPTVLVTLGTANADATGRFLTECLRAFADRPGLRAVVADPAGAVGPAPANVLLLRRIPQLELLPRVDAVVCHAGHNTVCESLYYGLPLVVAPIRDDQPVVAQQVVDAGAGIRVRFGRATAAHIGAAVEAVLTEEGYRAGARRVAGSFRAAGGPDAAAELLEQACLRSPTSA